MRRAVILATLTLLLFAIAGVTAATENTFTSSPQAGDTTESTTPEPTGPEPAALKLRSPKRQYRRRLCTKISKSWMREL